jgi:amidophosphoribosyltransferase
MCGIAFIRLRKPFGHYVEKYGTYLYGLNKLYLLMQKQNNRGQDGAGLASVKINIPAGKRYVSRYRSNEKQPLEDLFKKVDEKIGNTLKNQPLTYENAEMLKEDVAFLGEVYLGHLRYGTHGGNSIENCHPFHRQSNWRSRNLVLAGNFNLTNVEQLFDKLVELGQHPKDKVDTVLIMEKIGHFLDEENARFLQELKGDTPKAEITEITENELDLVKVLARSCRDFDGGYAIAGITGYGASFVVRDPAGIRPAYYYADEEVVVVASEKSAIKTAFNVDYDQIQEVQPAHALIIDKAGNYQEHQIAEAAPKTSCTFERIYFSRGTDPMIYNERKQLGRLLTNQVLEAVDYDLENTIFSYIPNTSETAFLGLTKGVDHYLIQERKKAIFQQKLSEEELEKILSFRPRVEKLAIKDVKMRTFIAGDDTRDELVAHVYDTTYEIVRKGIDNIVLIDDSIVRGTTLEKSILRMMDRLNPKKIVIVSSAPQIRFPDCYGIDMSRIGDFIVFRAVKALLKETGREHLLEEVYERCMVAKEEGEAGKENFVKALYAPFTDIEISNKVAELVGKGIKAEVQVIFQTSCKANSREPIEV